MKKIKIAIIDSGVYCQHPAFLNNKPFLICDDETIDTKNFYGHGTAIYNIISRVSDIADIVNFKLWNVGRKTERLEALDGQLSFLTKQRPFLMKPFRSLPSKKLSAGKLPGKRADARS